ncbi:TIM44-like domain-containing protein [Candidatus Uhrbacteria bacterium]|nr:TIM44-like domain-containing protein [Candidatus Uhrbacteria bacterium]
MIAMFVAIAVGARRHRYAKLKRVDAVVAAAATSDRAWDADALLARVRDVFTRFQAAWSARDANALAPLLTESYRKRMVLELAVLQAEHRRNTVERPTIRSLIILDAVNAKDHRADRVTVEVIAQAHDVLRDDANDRVLFTDDAEFTEYWVFAREDGEWQLERIRQSTEDPSRTEQQIIAFAERHGFSYDADFGWLMMPNVGYLFRKSNFKTSDINNHVIGYHRDKVVEFYTFIPKVSEQRTGGFFIAQAVLPKSYHDILIRRRRWWSGFVRPRGLRRITLESPEFNRRFCLWAHPIDQANSLELLHPTFMERVASLPFTLDIELVGNFLYLATKDRKNPAQFDTMLDVLNGAFDEMER